MIGNDTEKVKKNHLTTSNPITVYTISCFIVLVAPNNYLKYELLILFIVSLMQGVSLMQ